MGVVNTGIANCAGDSDVMFVSTIQKNRSIVTQGSLHIYKTLKDGDVKRMIANIPGEEVLNLAYHCVARVD